MFTESRPEAGERRKVTGRQERGRYGMKWKGITTKATERCSLCRWKVFMSLRDCKLSCVHLACAVLLEIWEIFHKNWDFWLFLRNLQYWPFPAFLHGNTIGWKWVAAAPLKQARTLQLEKVLTPHTPTHNCFISSQKHSFMLSAGPLQAFEFVTSSLKEALELPTVKKFP